MPAPSTRILLVDDDDLARQLLAHALKRQGFEVIECRSGPEALALLETSGPVLLVLDYEMPELTGAQICARIRGHAEQRISTLPIILLTAHSGESHEIESLQAGADDFVTKPINIPILKARIDTQLRLHELRAQLQEQMAELEEWRHRHERDLEAASLTQKAILPQRAPPLDGWEVAAHYEPVIAVGGDVFDWLKLTDGSWLFWIADATGHGVSAALLTALTKLLFRHAATEHDSAARIIQAVNAEFFGIFRGRTFMTAAALVIRPGNDRIRFAGAGHPPLFIARENSTVEMLPSLTPPLGIVAEMAAEESLAAIARGDTLLLYTDGLYSMLGHDGNRMVPDELADFFPKQSASARDFLAATIDAAAALAAGTPIPDDLTALALRRL